MLSEKQKKIFQYAGGGLIIACAFAIMLPGFISYAASFWRFIVIIVSVVASSWLVVLLYHKFRPKKQ
ncbi:MAG: hypothetical protein K2Z81_08255 [Cyanobacteria bacterium]|nr:hypothetical protein [Cyanobacteriota bacterium]